jgi:hypothetical protein
MRKVRLEREAREDCFCGEWKIVEIVVVKTVKSGESNSSMRIHHQVKHFSRFLWRIWREGAWSWRKRLSPMTAKPFYHSANLCRVVVKIENSLERNHILNFMECLVVVTTNKNRKLPKSALNGEECSSYFNMPLIRIIFPHYSSPSVFSISPASELQTWHGKKLQRRREAQVAITGAIANEKISVDIRWQER